MPGCRSPPVTGSDHFWNPTGHGLVGGQVGERGEFGHRQQVTAPETTRREGGPGAVQPVPFVVVVLGVGGECGGQRVRASAGDVAGGGQVLYGGVVGEERGGGVADHGGVLG